MRFFTRSAVRHGGESDTYGLRVSTPARSGAVTMDLEWPNRVGGTQHGEFVLEPESARWLAYALLKAVEEGSPAELYIERGSRIE